MTDNYNEVNPQIYENDYFNNMKNAYLRNNEESQTLDNPNYRNYDEKNENNDQENLHQTENNLKLFESKFKKFQESSNADHYGFERKVERHQDNYSIPQQRDFNTEDHLRALNYNYSNANQIPYNINHLKQYTDDANNEIELKNDNLHMKVNNINLEAENKALKEKIHELSLVIKSYNHDKSNQISIKEANNLKFQLLTLMEEKQKTDMIINELEYEKNKSNGRVERLIKEMENLSKEIEKKDEIFKKISEEKESSKSLVDSLKRDINNSRNNIDKKDDEIAILNNQLSELEKGKLLLERRIANLESQVKNSKFEFDNVNKTVTQLKKQNDIATNKIEELKADNYNLKQEVSNFKNKSGNSNTYQAQEKSGLNSKKKSIDISSAYYSKPIQPEYQEECNDKTNYNNYMTGQTKNSNNKFQQKYSNIEEYSEYRACNSNNKINEITSNDNNSYSRAQSAKFNSKETGITNSNYLKKPENTIEIIKKKNLEPTDIFALEKNKVFEIEQKLADLTSQKKQIENEIFKLPEKPKTLIQINRRKMLEEQVSAIDKEINIFRIKLREGNKR